MVSANVATTEVNSTTNALIKVINDFVSTCDTTQVNLLNISASGNCNLTITNTTITQRAVFNGQCVSNIQNSSELDQKLQEEITSSANAIASAISASANADVAINITKSVTNLSQQIKNSYFNTCVLTQKNINNITCTDNSTLTLGGVDILQTSDATVSCIFNNASVISAQQDLQKIIDASSTAQVEFPTWLIIIIAVIVIIIIIIIIVVIVSSTSG